MFDIKENKIESEATKILNVFLEIEILLKTFIFHDCIYVLMCSQWHHRFSAETWWSFPLNITMIVMATHQNNVGLYAASELHLRPWRCYQRKMSLASLMSNNTSQASNQLVLLSPPLSSEFYLCPNTEQQQLRTNIRTRPFKEPKALILWCDQGRTHLFS